jgi:uncharacterized membrane protein YidH (DUF202 family)
MAGPTAPDLPDDIEDRDPGLARERTDLAWTRTAVSFAALGAAMLRSSTGTGALVMFVGAAVWGLGQLSARDAEAGAGRRRLDPRHTVQLIAAVTTLVAAVALALVVLAAGNGHH